MLVPVAAAPTADLSATAVTDSADVNLWNADMSPSGRWICFQATTPALKSSTLFVTSVDGRPSKVTDGAYWDDKPQWSPDGRILYFVSDRGGLLGVWGIGFDRARGVPVGEAFSVLAFSGRELQISPSLEGLELAVGGRRIAIPVEDPSGGIWMLGNIRR